MTVFLSVSESFAAADTKVVAGERLHLVPIAIKDMIDVAGFPTTCGTRVILRRPRQDAAVVAKLKAAGFEVVGKTNMHELAMGITGENPHFGTVENPFDRGRIVGGSSSGSAAAVALGYVSVAVGSDTAGSVRIPAAFCGIWGFKPSYGLLSMEGCMPLSPSLDHLGVFAKNAGGLEDVFLPIAPPLARASAGKTIKVGVLGRYARELVSEDTNEKLKRFVTKVNSSGWLQANEIDIPHIDKSWWAGKTIVFKEAWREYSLLLEKRELLGRDVVLCLEAGRDIVEAEYNEALTFRSEFTCLAEKLFSEVDYLLLPAVADVAPPAGTKKITSGGKMVPLAQPLTALNYPASLAGLPTVSVPCFAGSALPVGFQIIGKRNSDLDLLAFCRKLEEHKIPL